MVTMRIVERPEIKGRHVQCISCGVNTRSHVLEIAEYEEYEEVWEDDEIEEYQARKKGSQEEDEEENIVIRYRLHTEQTCICHTCWLDKKAKAVKFLNKNKATWLEEGAIHLTRIKKFMSSWNYYHFGQELEESTQEDIDAIKNALLGLGEEE